MLIVYVEFDSYLQSVISMCDKDDDDKDNNKQWWKKRKSTWQCEWVIRINGFSHTSTQHKHCLVV